MRQYLRPTLTFGNNNVDVYVRHSNGEVVVPNTEGKPDDVISLFDDAFRGNKYYIETHTRYFGTTLVAFPIFTNSVISIYNDDRSDYYSYSNYVAAELFQSILSETVYNANVMCSTKPEDKPLAYE